MLFRSLHAGGEARRDRVAGGDAPLSVGSGERTQKRTAPIVESGGIHVRKERTRKKEEKPQEDGDREAFRRDHLPPGDQKRHFLASTREVPPAVVAEIRWSYMAETCAPGLA